MSRFGASASSSSMKMMAGALASACSNTSRSADSASPGRLAMISGPLTVRNLRGEYAQGRGGKTALRGRFRAPREYEGYEYSEYDWMRPNTADYMSSR